MTLHVHLVPSLAGVDVGAAVTVEGDEAHHAVAVRRLRSASRSCSPTGSGTVGRRAR